VDQGHAGLDDGDLAVLTAGIFWACTGRTPCWAGRLLGMGSGGERELHAMAHGTAFLHSVMMQEKKGMMKSWNVWLIFSTFC